MSTYVMSDIHGCHTAFQDMLKKIHFSKDDHLIIAGDLVDRGPENYEMLCWLEKKPDNIEVLMGNHDYDFANYAENLLNQIDRCPVSQREAFAGKVEQGEVFISSVYDKYGTIREMIVHEKLKVDQLRKWVEIIRAFPYYKKMKISGKKYIVVHAGYTERLEYDYAGMSLEEFYIWAREMGVREGGEPGATIVFGHTPTISHGFFANNGKVFRIHHNDCDFIDIDCGYVYRDFYPEGNMACIRLEDEEIFYLIEGEGLHQTLKKV